MSWQHEAGVRWRSLTALVTLGLGGLLLAGCASPSTSLSSTTTMVPASPFPVKISGLPWTAGSAQVGPRLTFGTTATFASSGSSLCHNQSGSATQWSVWCDGMAQFPVTSTDHGHQWTVAGPLLANDWVGGSLYYVTRVTACSPTVVAMVGIAVVDVTVDGGHAWTQFVTEGSLTGEWDISVAGCARRAQGHPADVVLHVVIATAGPQQGDSATYATDDGGDTWLRQSEHVG